MTNWNCLPIATRKEIVKRLDFRTRFRFRHVSRTDKELVDSVPLYIPLVALSVKNENEAVLTFYTGIEKWIQVEYVGDGEGKTSVKVKETSNSTVTQHGAIRQVTTPNPLMLALSAFKHVAMNPNTLSGGIDLRSTRFIKFATAQDTDTFFGGRKFRTKVFYNSDDDCYDLSMRISTGDLEEYRKVVVANEKSPCFVYTYTRRVTARVEEEDVDKWKEDWGFSWHQSYIFPTEQQLKQLMATTSSAYHAPMPGVHVERVGADGYFVHDTTQENGHGFEMITPCGHVIWNTPTDVKIENPSTGCSMRWACPKHADPFDHWYIFKVSKSNDYPQKANDVIKNMCVEFVYPIVNGKCPLEAQLFKWATDYETLFANKKHAEQKVQEAARKSAESSAEVETADAELARLDKEEKELDAKVATLSAKLAKLEQEQEELDKKSAELEEASRKSDESAVEHEKVKEQRARIELEQQVQSSTASWLSMMEQIERVEQEEEQKADNMGMKLADRLGLTRMLGKPGKKGLLVIRIGFAFVGLAFVAAILVALFVI